MKLGPTSYLSTWGGSPVKQTKRLTNVKTYVGETVVRDYQLQHETGTATGRSRLVSITECGGGLCLPPTLFDWQEGGDGTFQNVSNPVNPAQLALNYSWPGDYNGDGLTDLATQENSLLFTHFSNGDGTYSKVFTPESVNDFETPIVRI
jgi:hypothetical protein